MRAARFPVPRFQDANAKEPNRHLVVECAKTPIIFNNLKWRFGVLAHSLSKWRLGPLGLAIYFFGYSVLAVAPGRHKRIIILFT
jgi:hypothetical protein